MPRSWSADQMKDLSIRAIAVSQGFRSLRDSASYWVRAGLCSTDQSISKLSSSSRGESFYVWNWGSCARAEITSSQVSCCTPKPYIFFFEAGSYKFSSMINKNRWLGWWWRGTDNSGPSSPPSRRFIPVNSITWDWSGHDKPFCVNFKNIYSLF